jgi:hypothetical protein
MDDALPLMADVALRPTFSTTELERLRKERLTSLLQARDDPSSLASAAFARMVFGPRHRYGTLLMGNDRVERRDDRRGDARVLHEVLPAAERAPDCRGRRHGRGHAAETRESLWRLEERSRAGEAGGRDGHATWSTPDLSGGQARRRTVADQNRLGWSSAIYG